MASAARVHIAERGRDPRRYVLLATGGAGPVHAWYLAARLGIERPAVRRRRLRPRAPVGAGPERFRGQHFGIVVELPA